MPQYCFDEEFPVTLQVAFIATDGWLFASDTLETNRGPQSRTTRHTRKISYDRKSGLIWLVCGDLISRRAADDVAAAYAGGEFPDEYSFPTKLREIGNKRWDKEAENPARKEFPSFRASIYAFPGQSCFWGLEVAEESHSTAIGDKTVIGDRGNSAAFFSEQYYSPDATVTQLIPLAAHIILMGHHRQSAGVDGLEIVFSEKGEIHEWRRGSPALEQYLTLSNELNSEIKARLGFSRVKI